MAFQLSIQISKGASESAWKVSPTLLEDQVMFSFNVLMPRDETHREKRAEHAEDKTMAKEGRKCLKIIEVLKLGLARANT